MTGVAFIDLRKAFDTVNHELLLTKLAKLGCSNLTLKWFKSYFEKHTHRVCFKGATSRTLVPFWVHCFFSIFVNTLPNSVTDGTMDMYADYVTHTVSGTHADEIKQKLSDGVCQVMNWIDANKLVLNVVQW